jgi:hypothetical protein
MKSANPPFQSAAAASIRRMFTGCCAVVTAIVLSSCASSVPIGKTVPVSASEDARSSLRSANPLRVYEGLPHQNKEQALLKTELARRETIRLHGYPFYTPAVAAKNDATLRRILANPSSFRPYTGPKTCGGFHPDYAVSWTTGGASSHLLICFGCGEALFSHQGTLLPYDIRHGELAELQATLAAHAAKRP